MFAIVHCALDAEPVTVGEMGGVHDTEFLQAINYVDKEVD